MINDPFSIGCVLTLIVFLSVLLEKHSGVMRKLGSAFIAITIAVVISNIGLIPDSSSAYDFILEYVVSSAIILILMGVDLRTIMQSGKKMMGAFFLGALATIAGSVAMGFILVSQLGPETWKLSGLYSGTFVGGSVNFAAVNKELDVDPDLFNAALAADVLVTSLWLMVCLLVPLLAVGGKKMINSKLSSSDVDTEKFSFEKKLFVSRKPVSLLDFSAILTITLTVILMSKQVAAWLPGVPEVIALSVIAILLAQLKPVGNIAGASMIGNYLLLLFFAANGAKSVISNIIQVGPFVFYFCLGVIVIHGIILFVLGRLLKFDFKVLAVASQANIGGAASAIAIASTRGYTDEIGPGTAVALLGYMIGNFIGLGVASAMHIWLA